MFVFVVGRQFRVGWMYVICLRLALEERDLSEVGFGGTGGYVVRIDGCWGLI